METYKLHVAGLERDLPICPLNDNLSIAGFVMFGDVEMTIRSAEELLKRVGDFDLLITAESMSAYIAYKATVGMPEARRTVVSNIHRAGTIPAEAGAHIAEIIKIMLDKKASGTDLKL